jgi:VRR-NUC domain
MSGGGHHRGGARRRQQPEAQIQRAVIQHLQLRPAAGVFAFHVPNGGARRPIEAAILKSLGVTAGVPDLIIVKDGHTHCLELKSESGRLTAAQKATHDALRAAGASVAVADNLDAALQQLEEWQLLRGTVS